MPRIADQKLFDHNMPSAPDEAVLVLGSRNAHVEDRRLDREQIRPAWLLVDGKPQALPFFDRWGELGMNSAAFDPAAPQVLYLATDDEVDTPGRVLRLDLATSEVTELDVPDLRDTHELTLIGDTLWAANTGRNEAVGFNTVKGAVETRIRLEVNGANPRLETQQESGDIEVPDKFHCNQVFTGYDGKLYALVHYAYGKQFLRRVNQKLIKRQGNGGVIDLSGGGTPIPLALRAPHNVRLIDGDYWVCNSAESLLHVYDAQWQLRETVRSHGWGRGASLSKQLGVLYVGISETRKRYLDLIPKARQASTNMVQAVSVADRAAVAEVAVPDVEQVNGVYVVSREVGEALLALA